MLQESCKYANPYNETQVPHKCVYLLCDKMIVGYGVDVATVWFPCSWFYCSLIVFYCTAESETKVQSHRWLLQTKCILAASRIRLCHTFTLLSKLFVHIGLYRYGRLSSTPVRWAYVLYRTEACQILHIAEHTGSGKLHVPQPTVNLSRPPMHHC